MKEHPIIFNSEMVRAILDGRKTQTRRVVKFPRHAHTPDTNWIASVNPDGKDGWIAWGPRKTTDEDSRKAYPNGGGFKCRYGVPGDLLWVRETWQYCPFCGGTNYSAGANDNGKSCQHCDNDLGVIWKPSIHMRYEDSRITLRVKDVRVERIKSISMKDVLAEGLDYENGRTARWFDEGEHYYIAGSPYIGEIYAFMRLWNSINAARGHSWDTNPWVWVVEFERV